MAMLVGAGAGAGAGATGAREPERERDEEEEKQEEQGSSGVRELIRAIGVGELGSRSRSSM